MLYATTLLSVIDIKVLKFNGGEMHVKVAPIDAYEQPITIVSMPMSSDDLMATLLAIDAIKRTYNPTKLTLNLMYLPYARQDRQCEKGESFSLHVFSNLLNTFKLDKVILNDPHSDVGPALINNATIVDQVQCLQMALQSNPEFSKLMHLPETVIVSPDAGASKKILSVCKHLKKPTYIRADKVRNTATGAITDTVVLADDLTGVNCVIVDDICDGGGTFTALAQKLKEKNAETVTLYVTHGIFSRGKQLLLNSGIDNICTLHDWTKLKDNHV